MIIILAKILINYIVSEENSCEVGIIINPNNPCNRRWKNGSMGSVRLFGMLALKKQSMFVSVENTPMS